MKSRRSLELGVVHDSISEVPDEDELGVCGTSSENLGEQAVPGSSLDVSLLQQLADDVSCSEAEGVDEHLWFYD
jgi:hypothetical protein